MPSVKVISSPVNESAVSITLSPLTVTLLVSAPLIVNVVPPCWYSCLIVPFVLL